MWSNCDVEHFFEREKNNMKSVKWNGLCPIKTALMLTCRAKVASKIGVMHSRMLMVISLLSPPTNFSFKRILLRSFSDKAEDGIPTLLQRSSASGSPLDCPWELIPNLDEIGSPHRSWTWWYSPSDYLIASKVHSSTAGAAFELYPHTGKSASRLRTATVTKPTR